MRRHASKQGVLNNVRRVDPHSEADGPARASTIRRKIAPIDFEQLLAVRTQHIRRLSPSARRSVAPSATMDSSFSPFLLLYSPQAERKGYETINYFIKKFIRKSSQNDHSFFVRLFANGRR